MLQQLVEDAYKQLRPIHRSPNNIIGLKKHKGNSTSCAHRKELGSSHKGQFTHPHQEVRKYNFIHGILYQEFIIMNS